MSRDRVSAPPHIQPHFRLYGHSWCSLCDDMEAALANYATPVTFSFERVDIGGNAELEARFCERVPVLTDEAGTVICEGRFDPTAFANGLSPLARPNRSDC